MQNSTITLPCDDNQWRCPLLKILDMRIRPTQQLLLKHSQWRRPLVRTLDMKLAPLWAEGKGIINYLFSYAYKRLHANGRMSYTCFLTVHKRNGFGEQ